MEAREHKGKTLRYLAIEPDGYDADLSYPMIILLHGFGAHMGDLAGVIPAIDTKGYVYICPNAPLEVELGPGMVGYAWTPAGGTRSPADTENAETRLATLFDEVMDQYSVKPGNVILGGFSQGGMMTYRLGLPNPTAFRGLIALSARVSDKDELRPKLPSEPTQSIFIAHGTLDSIISVEDARQSLAFLTDAGYGPEYHEYNIAHAISEEVLTDMADWIKRVVAPLGSL